jgi:hypothetical protein
MKKNGRKQLIRVGPDKPRSDSGCFQKIWRQESLAGVTPALPLETGS